MAKALKIPLTTSRIRFVIIRSTLPSISSLPASPAIPDFLMAYLLIIAQRPGSMSGDPELMLRSAVSILRAQRKYLSGNQMYIDAYNIGIRFWQRRYGQPLVEELLRYFRIRMWKQGVIGTITLLRYYPDGFMHCAYRSFRKTATALSALCRYY